MIAKIFKMLTDGLKLAQEAKAADMITKGWLLGASNRGIDVVLSKETWYNGGKNGSTVLGTLGA
jgi:hypothetical protein